MLPKLLTAPVLAAAAQAVSFTVSSSGGNATSPYQYGLMFEDINNSGDGGVYAELIQKRAFQGDEIFPKNLTYWNALGGAKLSLQDLSDPLSDALPTSMQVAVGDASEDTIGFSNEGFWGFPVVEGWQYNGSFWAVGGLDGNITVCLVSNEDEQFAEASVQVSTSDSWTQYNYTIVSSVSAPNSNNTLNFTFAASDLSGSVNFNLLSLFPPTYNDRPNGNRVDLMEAMGGLNPSFFRMPGGNNLEGLHPPHWWNWTNSIGPLEDRPGFAGAWAYEQTNGLGLVEYLLWADDLGMEPVLAVWAGLYLENETVPADQLQPYVQSALDELEFLMGDASTTWGARREALGYGPWQINYVEIGNEDSLHNGPETYASYRFEAFYDAIHAAYPNITIIASYFDVVDGHPPHDGTYGDIHEYAVPVQMSSQFGFFDNYTTEYPILIGEYAVVGHDWPGVSVRVHSTPRVFAPFWYGSVAEAIYLLGAERNSHKIMGASYAPSFQNLNRWEWVPDLIQYDAYPGHTTYTTSYHMIQLLSNTRITENLPMTITDGEFGPAYFVAGRNDVTGAHIAKFAVYNSSVEVPFSVSFDGVGAGAIGNLTYMTAPFNSSNPIGGSIIDREESIVTANSNGTFSFELPEYSIAVLEIGANSAGAGCNYGGPGSRHGWQGWNNWNGGKGNHGHGHRGPGW